MSEKRDKVIGFIGLGAIGKYIAMNILKSGHPMCVFDVVESSMDPFRKLGAETCSSVAELAGRCDIVMLSLPNGKIVESVVKGEDGLLENGKQGMYIIDASTVSPPLSRSLAEAARSYDIRFADTPVSGGITGAEAGTLTVMVGCDDDLYEELLPVLEIIGKKIFHVGKPGMGNAIKLVNNLLLGANMAALSEALVLGVKLGLDADTMKDIIGVSSGRSYALETRLEKMILTGEYEGGFSIDLQQKDLKLVIEAAGEVSVPTPMASSATTVYEAARAKGLNKLDIGALVGVWEELCDIKISESRK